MRVPSSVIDPPALRGRDRYERVVEGWIDNPGTSAFLTGTSAFLPDSDDAFTHTVQISEPDRAIELRVVATTSPGYMIRDARCRALVGDVAASVVDGVRTLAGTAMVAGLTRRAAEAAGTGAGAALVRDAVIEVARLARQAIKLDPVRAEQAVAAGAAACWQLDSQGWVDLPGSCFTYSDAGRALFATRSVSTPMRADLYAPRPGQQRVFVRKKVSRLERRERRLHLFHSMHDDVHGFELTYEIDLDTGRIVDARSLTPKLPYAGICSEPQQKIGALIGESVDAGFVKRLQSLVGGSAGCAQLFDLTADVFRLLV